MQVERLLRIAAEEARLERRAAWRRRRRIAGVSIAVAMAVSGAVALVGWAERGVSGARGDGAVRLYRARGSLGSSLPAPWPVADGGNGHWYQFIAFGPTEGIEPEEVASRARRMGASIARPSDAAEVRFLAALVGRTGVPDEVDDAGLLLRLSATGFFLEWSADCDGDGLVDFGEIRSGEETDANGDGVPDRCG